MLPPVPPWKRRSSTSGDRTASPEAPGPPFHGAPSRRGGRAAGAVFGLGSFVVRHYRPCALLVLALMAGNVFLRLGSSSVNDFDEARYGVTAFEMQQHGGLVVPTYAGEKELLALKPPLGYWLMALSFRLFGGSALAMRLPSALCALAAVAVSMIWARRWFNRRASIFAGLIVATTFGYLSHHGARSGDFDSCLTFILLLVAVRLPELNESAWSVVPIAVLLACGFLLKSFAIVPMVVVAAGYLLWTGAWRRQRLVPCLAALGVFGVIVGAWAALRWRADGSPDFLLRMVREDVVGRSTAIVDESTSSPVGYLAALFDRFAPWPLVILAAAGAALRSGRPLRLRRGRVMALLLLWAGLPLVIVSAMRTQHHWYLDPTYPALAMLAAGGALWLVRRSPGRLRILAVAGLVALPLGLCEARLLGRVLVKEPMSADQRFLRSLRPLAASGCREVRSTCILAYSERFILEVEDGFEIVEPAGAGPGVAAPPGTWSAGPGSAGPGPGAAGPADTRPGRPRPASARSMPDGFAAAACVLVGKSVWRVPPAPPASRLPPRELLLAESPSYAFYRGAKDRALP
ncbi:MAG TPA: glycosyltransferase family 39 protein [Thermoanaerobaculia bacterium]|nr:glycosyltransferase family 39 protein [Thermoanaerobaculia bacterium]